MDAAVAIDKWMDVDEAEGQGGGSDDRIKRARGSAIEGNHAVDEREQITRPGADMVRDRHAGLAVVFSDKAAFLPQSEFHEARIADHDGLEPQQLLDVNGALS